MSGKFLYLVGESLDENGDKKVEEDVVPKRHQSDKVKSSPVTGSLHPGKEDNVPVLLCQHLNTQIFLDLKYIKKKTSGDAKKNDITWKTVTVAQSKESKFFLSLIPVSGSTNLQPNRFIPRILKYFTGFEGFFVGLTGIST